MTTKIFTCEECRYYDETTRTMSTCSWDGKCHDGTDELCPAFRTKDGKQPRFCRMASEVEEMVSELVVYGMNHARCQGWLFQDEIYDRVEPAVEAAKAWLMECEGGNETVTESNRLKGEWRDE